MSGEDARSVAAPQPMLLVISGRPGTGKTTLAKAAVRRLRACYLRVDAAETALSRTGLAVGVEGYAVVHELAVSNLLLGVDVVVDAVNPVPEARHGWVDTADRGGARLLHVETSLPDAAEHRRRVEQRTADIPGHAVPTWDEVARGTWVPWDENRDGRRVLIDMTRTGEAIEGLSAAVRRP